MEDEDTEQVPFLEARSISELPSKKSSRQGQELTASNSNGMPQQQTEANSVTLTPTTSGQNKPAAPNKLSQSSATLKKSSERDGVKVLCANVDCRITSSSALEAPSYAKLYLRLGNSKSKQAKKLCTGCFNKAKLSNEVSKGVIKRKDNLFNLKFKAPACSPANIDLDLDSPVNSPGPDSEVEDEDDPEEETYSYSISELHGILEQTFQKYDLEKQVKQCTATVNQEAEELDAQYSSLELEMEAHHKKLDRVFKFYNENFANVAKPVEIGSVDIPSRSPITVTISNSLGSQLGDLSLPQAAALSKAVEDLKAVGRRSETTTNGAPVPAPPLLQRFEEVVSKPLPPPTTPKTPRIAKLKFVKPKQGQNLFGMQKNALDYWRPAKILKISTNKYPTTYTVDFQERIESRNKVSTSNVVMELTGKQLAYKRAFTQLFLPVGTRVIANYKALPGTDLEVDGKPYAGIVGEIPTTLNLTRYLIFFDDGCAQYAQPKEVFPVVDFDFDAVWLDVHKTSQEFIRSYLSKFPERHMIRVELDAVLKVELNGGGGWKYARVVEVDCSLLKVQYEGKKTYPEYGSYDWIYRGSLRLWPLYWRLKSLGKRKSMVARRHISSSSRNSNILFEIHRNGGDEEEGPPPKVIKKDDAVLGAGIRTKNGNQAEAEGTIAKIEIPKVHPPPRPYAQHVCEPTCCSHRYDYDGTKYRSVSPSAIPFHLGWSREVSKDQVYYRTPCGINCGSYRDIHNYVVQTGGNIPMNFFSLETDVDCLNEFHPSRVLKCLEDISSGKELVSISFVNSLDHELPPKLDYISERILGDGVEISEDDDGFLLCCDCEDDCQDKEKCLCWQQTFSGIAFKIAENEGFKLEGYENRRLKNHVSSGIYECNRKCKCRSTTCFNRVVQNKVQWPLQLFKTEVKGWGVRTLHDMPQGTFICSYAGRILTDDGANEIGTEAGDEYLAELNFIEFNEMDKEGYESDATDIEMEEPGTRSNARVGKMKSTKSTSTHGLQVTRKSGSKKVTPPGV